MAQLLIEEGVGDVEDVAPAAGPLGVRLLTVAPPAGETAVTVALLTAGVLKRRSAKGLHDASSRPTNDDAPEVRTRQVYVMSGSKYHWR